MFEGFCQYTVQCLRFKICSPYFTMVAIKSQAVGDSVSLINAQPAERQEFKFKSPFLFIKNYMREKAVFRYSI